MHITTIIPPAIKTTSTPVSTWANNNVITPPPLPTKATTNNFIMSVLNLICSLILSSSFNAWEVDYDKFPKTIC